jgi:hypothetical protein
VLSGTFPSDFVVREPDCPSESCPTAQLVTLK